MLNKELKKFFSIIKINDQKLPNVKDNTCQDPGRVDTIPIEFDWNVKGKVTAIRQQGSCGSCFIFSAVAVAESSYLIHGDNKIKKDDLDISEQALLDCHPLTTCRTGGWPSTAWYMMKQNGIVDEKNSPYKGKVS